MTDLQKAIALFGAMKSKGFGVQVRDFSNREDQDEEFDWSAVSISLLDSRKAVFVTFDFLDGDFYRVSGTDSTGWYGDEVDLKKYV